MVMVKSAPLRHGFGLSEKDAAESAMEATWGFWTGEDQVDPHMGLDLKMLG